MAVTFSATVKEAGVRIEAGQRGLLSRKIVPSAEWPSLPGMQGRAASVLFGLTASGDATVGPDHVALSHAAAARLPSSIADTLGLPPLATLSATLSSNGNVISPNGSIRVRWYDENLRMVAPGRSGAFLEWGKRSGRLTAGLFDLLQATDAFNASNGKSTEERIALWQPVQAGLRAVTGIEVDDAFLKSLNIYQAGSFALDVRPGVDGPDFLPVLMSRSKAITLDDEAPAPEGGFEEEPQASFEYRDETADALLTPDLQRQFAESQFAPATVTRDAYVLGKNTFLVLDPDLKTALDVVRRKRRASPEERKGFVRNPRPALAEALHRDGGDETSALLFVETKQYSERVEGLAKWDPPKLPWLRKKAGLWLPESFPIRIGERTVQVTPEQFEALVERVETSVENGTPEIEVDGVAHPSAEVQAAIAELRREWPSATDETAPPHDEAPDATAETGEEAAAPEADDLVLQLRTNLFGVEFETAHRARPNLIGTAMPQDRLASTKPKPHQIEGFDWLVKAWTSGWPGVLLADDMGLGKTFQALAFLAWMKSNQMRRPGAQDTPILVVAPTALLRTWAAEAELHLAPDALGERTDAFGYGLSRLKRQRSADWTPEDALDVDSLRKAGWILTTYETLADNHRAFARIAFSVAVFDEMQKVKAPGTINTHAAKAMNADFVIGLTGTPIENRLEDLWCIMDRVAPGYLGDLKSFSAAHKEENATALTDLKAKLDKGHGGAPPIMLRRMKEDILEGLPSKTPRSLPVVMPPAQAEAYARAVREAHAGERTMGAMLKAIHTLRGISLHPDGGEGVDGYDPKSANDWVARSGRVSTVIATLREIEKQGEKALVFVEDRAVQATFAQVLTTLFGMRSAPTVINGEVPGPKRQGMVDVFQAGAPGFDVLILSPKAAGIGLTITAANHVVHLSRWWNPAVEDQCNDRVYRIGQTKPVTIHIPIARHPDFGESSFDVTLDELLERKRSLSRHMLAPPVSESDVGDLFGKTVRAA
jgi:SNF2 family DNA or RNA helicase